MDSSALPYVLYFVFEIVAILAFAVIGHVQRRKLLLWVIAWLVVGASRNALIVLSAGQTPTIERETIRWLIRSLVYGEALLFASSAIAFVVENVQWRHRR